MSEYYLSIPTFKNTDYTDEGMYKMSCDSAKGDIESTRKMMCYCLSLIEFYKNDMKNLKNVGYTYFWHATRLVTQLSEKQENNDNEINKTNSNLVKLFGTSKRDHFEKHEDFCLEYFVKQIKKGKDLLLDNSENSICADLAETITDFNDNTLKQNKQPLGNGSNLPNIEKQENDEAKSCQIC